MTGYAPLGSPGRPYPNKDAEPIVLNDPVLKKIADKHETTVALVSVKLTENIYYLTWCQYQVTERVKLHED